MRGESQKVVKLSQEFSRTENRILGALACLDDFLMNPLIQGHSGTASETSRNAFSTSQGMNEDDSYSDPNPEARISLNQTAQNSGPEDGHDMHKGTFFGWNFNRTLDFLLDIKPRQILTGDLNPNM